MGLDSVELVMAWEHTFGISIPDAAAERMRTTRNVIDWFAARLPRNPAQPCGTQRAFQRVRAALITVAGAARAQVVPSAVVRDLLPAGESGEAWGGIGRLLGTPNWPRVASRFLTVRDLAHQAFVADPLGFTGSSGGWSRGNIRAVVRAVLEDEIGLADSSFTDDSLLHDDLGID